MDRKLIILDLDETLIFATEESLERPPDFIVCNELTPHVSDRVLDEGKDLNDRSTLLAMISELKG